MPYNLSHTHPPQFLLSGDAHLNFETGAFKEDVVLILRTLEEIFIFRPNNVKDPQCHVVVILIISNSSRALKCQVSVILTLTFDQMMLFSSVIYFLYVALKKIVILREFILYVGREMIYST